MRTPLDSDQKPRPTPETDAVFMTIAVGDFIDPYKDTLRFARDHCEELERQRDEARELCDFNAKQLLVAVNERNSLVVQRDRLLAALKALFEHHEIQEYQTLLKSWDNARTAIAEVEGAR